MFEDCEGEIINLPSRETGNIEYTRRRKAKQYADITTRNSERKDT